jgi:hypothetical protein
MDEDTTVLRTPGDTHLPSVSIAAVNLSLHNLHLTGRSSDSLRPISWNLAIKFADLSLSLGIVGNRRSAQQNPNPLRKAALDISLSCFQGKLREGEIDITWDAVSAELGHTSPEHIATTGMALGQSIGELSRLHHQAALRNSTLTGKIIYDVLKSSKNKSIIDPLSTIQPSYLVQSGRPHKLRTDPTFKFLFHLRNCLWHLADIERGAFRSLRDDGESIPIDDITPMLESRLVSLALDTETSNNTNLAILETIFPDLPHSTKQSKSKRHGDGFHMISALVKKIGIIVWDPLGVSSSEFTLGTLVLCARVRRHELVQPSISHSMTFSQMSLRDLGRQNIYHLILSSSVGDIGLTVSPHFLRFVQQSLRVRRHNSPTATVEAERICAANKDTAEVVKVDLVFSLHHLRIQAAAENLNFEFGTSGLQFSSSLLSGHTANLRDQSINYTIMFNEVFLRARSPICIFGRSGQDVLASLVLRGGELNAGIRQEPSMNATVRVILTMKSLNFNVPRSALRLYRFVEEWRADFLPDIEATLQALVGELQKSPTRSIPPSRSTFTFQVDAFVASFRVNLQIMHGTWLLWQINEVILYLTTSSAAPRDSTQTFGLQLASQGLSVSSPYTSYEFVSDARVTLELPTLSLTGHYDGSRIRARALVAFFDLTVKPSHWDTLLIVQQKFGQDFNDLMALIGETRRNKRSTAALQMSSPPSRRSWKYTGLLNMKGFRVGLEGPSSTVYLECEDIGGGADNNAGHTWHVRMSNLALSLASRAGGFALNRSHRSAFFIIDFETRGGSQRISQGHVLQVVVTRIHAVMQPNCFGELGDFVDHLQVISCVIMQKPSSHSNTCIG